jgi:hypothetical protein
MSAYYTRIYGETQEEAKRKAAEEIDRMDYMRQPSLYSVTKQLNDDGQEVWMAIIKYYGVD